MPTVALRQRRRHFRLLATLFLILLPSTGAYTVLLQLEGVIATAAYQQAILIWSCILHFGLLALFGSQLRRNVIAVVVASALALFLLPAMPLLPITLLADTAFILPSLTPMAIALCWIAGAALVLVARALRLLIPKARDDAAQAMTEPSYLILCGIVLILGFWLTLSALPLLRGGGFVPTRTLPALLAGLYALTASSLLVQPLVSVQHQMTRSSAAPMTVILAFVVAIVTVAAITVAPQVAMLGPFGAGVVLLLGAVLVGCTLWKHHALLFAFGFALTAAAVAFTLSGSAAGLATSMLFIVLLGAILGNQRHRSAGPAALQIGRVPPPDLLPAYHAASNSWLAYIDLDAKTLYFPKGTGSALGLESEVGFSEIFVTAQFSGLLDLVQIIQGDGALSSATVEIELAVKSPRGIEGHGLETFEVQVLHRSNPTAWLSMSSLSREKDLRSRLARYEMLLAEAVLREERLLSIASHELRTPIAILSMLGDELRSGIQWQDVGASFDKTLQRIVSILDDLRAGSGTEGGHAASLSFTLREMAQQVVEIFEPAAAGNGMRIRTDLGERCDLAIRCDYSRVFIALSKILHNAMVHSKATEIVLSAVILQGRDADLTVTWQIRDNGLGIAADRAALVFEPFETAGSIAEDRPGLGLYTARKAMRLMGGDLQLQSEGTGSNFVLTHPARVEPISHVTEQRGLTMSDVTPIYPGRRALLVEDNQLVGEITCARLRKLFQEVDWAESGDLALRLFREKDYDLIIVDQLLPGIIGSEVVQEIRQSNKAVPIIGITASTMGSECRDLEAAGVTYALEKPLNFAQLSSIADEFFGAEAQSESDIA